MKKMLAVILTACLICQTWAGAEMPVYAKTITEDTSSVVDGLGAGEIPEQDVLEKTDESGPIEEAKVLEEKDGAELSEEPTKAESELIVEVTSTVFSFQGKVNVKVNGSNAEDNVELDFQNAASKTARFTLAPGEYQITIQAEKFANYTQTITLEENYTNKIRVCTTETVLDGGKVCGWLRPGDMNQDGVINQEDVNVVLDAIRNNPEGTQCDISGDGKTDIADLQCVVQNMDEKSIESSVEKQLMAKVKDIQAVEGTTLVGMEEFLNHTGTVSLMPADTTAEISQDNPVGMEFKLVEDTEDPASIPVVQGMTIYAPVDVEPGEDVSSAITDGTAQVYYVDENGNESEEPLTVPLSATQSSAFQSDSMARFAAPRAASVKVEPDGSLVLDFGTQIAVKRVVITITGTKKTEPLVNIAKVEFVNNMEDRIPPPQLDIPELEEPVSGDKSLILSWTPQTNVTGYEIYISGPVKDSSSNESQIVRVAKNSQIVSSINDKSLVNFGRYTVKVRSVNGEWSSPWSSEKIGIVKPQKKPAKPDNVKAEGGYLNISVSWKKMDDSDGYMVYYKKSEEEDTQFKPVVEGFTQTMAGTDRIKGTSYVIPGLEMNMDYDVYVISWNECGWSGPSIVATATVLGSQPELPQYHLLNKSQGTGKVTEHITGAICGGDGGAHMEASPLDEGAGTAWGLVDRNYASYWIKADWDDGCSYYSNSHKQGVTISLDDYYKMSYMTFTTADLKYSPGAARVWYWEEGDTSALGKEMSLRLLRKTDKNGYPYFIVKFDMPVKANKIRMLIGNAGARELKIGEIQFHHYDSLEDDIMDLYVDEMHTTLREDVTEDTLKALEARVEQVDEESQEKHPLYSELMLEIRTAREILNGNLEPAFEVDNRISAAKDRHLGFGGLNAWQPLGKVGYEGESLIIYVGHNYKRTGVNSDLQLVFSQFHAESNAVASSVRLKIGRNVVTVPKLSSSKVEHGGQMYIAYTGNNTADKYAVRVKGGSNIPALSLYGKTGKERTDAIKAYVEELEAYVGTIESAHEETHVGTKNVDYPYDHQNCILNATDIMLGEMMYSIPATQAWAGIAGAEDKVAKLDNALKAMDDTMTLFYQHKGLSHDAGTAMGNNARPSQHLNIRYMRMFAGAFMYAAGNHIGIEWGSTTLATGPNNWSGFGWGIAHEIGHNINQGSYAIAEVTNNYFAQLLTGTTRFTYENVYKKVTSGTTGRASNVFTQLALYWQLHLAYDNQKDDKHIYDNYQEQFDNLFFARVDTYSRNPAKAPKSGLALNGGTEQNLMRLSCAAANKNILPFFERWGMVPDEATLAYAQKYGEPEEKALYYINQEARDYRVDHPETAETATVKDVDAVSEAVVTAVPNSSLVRINIKTNQQESLILGYEVSRSMFSNGQKKTEVIGFIPIDTANSTVYVDTISSINNRVMEYEVRAVDKYLNYSNKAYAGSAKIQTDGVLDKTEWTVETTMVSEDDVDIEVDEEDPDSGYDSTTPGNVAAKKEHSIDRVLDNDRTEKGTYHGTSQGTETITVDMHKDQRVTAIKYQGSPLEKVTVEISSDGSNWTKVKDNFEGFTGTEEKTLWFDSLTEDENGKTSIRENWIGTYHARYVRLTITQSGSVSIQEIEICGPSGDNLEFMKTDSGQNSIGVLSQDYKYGSQAEDVIPKGSLIFTGIYKGNPAYNVVMLYDTEGNVIGSRDGETHAEQVIFAEDPKDGDLGEMSDGTWVYYVRPEHWDPESLKSLDGVRGELYRVDDALTLSGERIASDTMVIKIPETLPEITLTGGGR